jgi:four helix bundle protein
MRDFKKLKIWQNGIDLTGKVYQLMDRLPNREKYGLVSQMTRCAVSIPSNIAEGGARNSQKEYKRFLEIALGSAFELETQLIICQKMDWVKNDDFDSLMGLLIEEQKMLSGFIRKLNIEIQ